MIYVRVRENNADNQDGKDCISTNKLANHRCFYYQCQLSNHAMKLEQWFTVINNWNNCGMPGNIVTALDYDNTGISSVGEISS